MWSGGNEQKYCEHNQRVKTEPGILHGLIILLPRSNAKYQRD